MKEESAAILASAKRLNNDQVEKTLSLLEVCFENKKKLMTINEIYAIGPAISVLMNGYVEKDKLISLRGTLVPATTINKTIAKIPLLGNILVGEKTTK